MLEFVDIIDIANISAMNSTEYYSIVRCSTNSSVLNNKRYRLVFFHPVIMESTTRIGFAKILRQYLRREGYAIC